MEADDEQFGETEITNLEFYNQLEEFETLLDSLTTSKDLKISQKDISLLAEIQDQLNNIPTIQSNSPRNAKKRSKPKLPFLLNEEENEPNSLLKIKKPKISKSRSSKIISAKIPDQLIFEKKPKNEIEKRNSLFMGELEDLEINQELFLDSLSFLSKLIKEKANHFRKFKIACINSAISIRTADHFVQNFGEILLGATNIVVLQRDLENGQGDVELFGHMKHSKVNLELTFSRNIRSTFWR